MYRTLTCIVLGIALFAGCHSSASISGDVSDHCALVGTTIPPIAWLVQQIGGSHVQTVCLLPRGADPHVFQPSSAEITRLLKCKLYFAAGLPCEEYPWFDSLRKSKRVQVVDLGQAVLGQPGQDNFHRRSHKAEVALADPHWWLSPKHLISAAKVVATHLSRIDPEHSRVYTENLSQTEKLLAELDRQLQADLHSFAGRPVLVYHPSWGHFTRRYGLRQIAVEHEGNPPTEQQITSLKKLVASEGIRTIFIQPQVAPTTAKQLAAGLGLEIRVLDPLAYDVPQALQAAASAFVASFQPDSTVDGNK